MKFTKYYNEPSEYEYRKRIEQMSIDSDFIYEHWYNKKWNYKERNKILKEVMKEKGLNIEELEDL